MIPQHVDGVFLKKFLTGDVYRSPEVRAGAFSRLLPSLSFYSRLFLGPVRWLCRRASQGRCDDAAWVYASIWTADLMERMGCPIEVEGMDAINAVDGPASCGQPHEHSENVHAARHDSRRPVTFVVKKSLTTMPFFGAVMRSRDPIVVGRVNPREDLSAVLNGGVERLKKGVSIIVFPQSTRSSVFDERHFNSIGVKLARRAGVPIVPLALKTDAWGQGKKIKELGPVKAGMTVRYRFARPICVQGQGKEEHTAICNYISSTLAVWQERDGINR